MEDNAIKEAVCQLIDDVQDLEDYTLWITEQYGSALLEKQKLEKRVSDLEKILIDLGGKALANQQPNYNGDIWVSDKIPCNIVHTPNTICIGCGKISH